jgi:hypothetical protein
VTAHLGVSWTSPSSAQGCWPLSHELCPWARERPSSARKRVGSATPCLGTWGTVLSTPLNSGHVSTGQSGTQWNVAEDDWTVVGDSRTALEMQWDSSWGHSRTGLWGA